KEIDNGNYQAGTWFVYDGANVLFDVNASNAVTVRYVTGDAPDQMVARIDSTNGVLFYLTDRQGSVLDVIGANGTLQKRLAYSATGIVIATQGGDPTAPPTLIDRYGYTGREYDSVTGLQYNRARYYDPATSRWITPDPMGFA